MSRNVILTAGHCIRRFPGSLVGDEFGDLKALAYGYGWYTPPLYDKSYASHDLGLLGIDISPWTHTVGEREVGSYVELAESALPDRYTRLWMNGQVVSNQNAGGDRVREIPGHVVHGDVTAHYDDHAEEIREHEPGNPCSEPGSGDPGDSGGALFVDRDGADDGKGGVEGPRPVIFGVESRTTMPDNDGFTIWAPVANHRRWLQIQQARIADMMWRSWLVDSGTPAAAGYVVATDRLVDTPGIRDQERDFLRSLDSSALLVQREEQAVLWFVLASHVDYLRAADFFDRVGRATEPVLYGAWHSDDYASPGAYVLALALDVDATDLAPEDRIPVVGEGDDWLAWLRQVAAALWIDAAENADVLELRARDARSWDGVAQRLGLGEHIARQIERRGWRVYAVETERDSWLLIQARTVSDESHSCWEISAGACALVGCELIEELGVCRYFSPFQEERPDSSDYVDDFEAIAGSAYLDQKEGHGATLAPLPAPFDSGSMLYRYDPAGPISLEPIDGLEQTAVPASALWRALE